VLYERIADGISLHIIERVRFLPRLPRATAENFTGGGSNGKKDRKLAKIPKNSTIWLLPGEGGQQKNKNRKIAKKGQKIALFSLYLLYLYNV